MKSNQKKQSFRAKKTTLLCTLAVCTALMANVPLASAGKAGVFVANDTYFTLENATFTAGSESSALQFSIKMHNGSSGAVDFNGYGVQIVDEQGNSYPAKLTSKQNARVNSGQDQQFSFVSQTGKNASVQNLKVQLFAWDSGSPTFTRNLGELSVASAVSNELDPAKLMLISLKDVDSSYSQDALVAMRLGQSYPVTENGVQYLFTDLYVRNAGSSNFQLPSSLQFRLKGTDSLTYTTSIVNTGQDTLIPDKLTKVRLRTPVPSSFDPNPFVLEAFYSEDSVDRIAGSVPLAGTTATVPLGTEQPYSLYGMDKGLKIKADQALSTRQNDGILVQSTVTVRNDGNEVVALPALSATYMLDSETLAASVQDKSVTTGFLAPKQSATYNFSVLVPSGVDPATVKLALMESESSSSSSSNSSSNTNSSSSSNSSSKSSTNSSSSNSTTSGTNESTNTNANSSTSNSNSTSNNSSTKNSVSTVNANSIPVMIIDLKGIQQTNSATVQAKPYQLGTPLPLAPNGLIDKNLEVSLVELHMHENTDFGYKTAIAKYKITNKGNGTLVIPDIGTELVNDRGESFSGVKQSSTTTTIMPNTSYVVSYSYMIPTDVTGQSLALNVIDPKSAAPNKLSIGSFQVAVQSESSDKLISFYPFDVSFDAYSIATLYNNGYVYQLSLDLNITRKDPVIVDQNFSKMEFDLVDGQGRILGSTSASFTGTEKLISGNQKISFSNIKTEQFDNNLTINVYETIETPSGTAKRLVKQLTQN
ncbi:hypothetical protein [Paenibacillus sp. RC67]|uniref:hypothetical protein n=1 Tax=Paenibacillus sp. RC67 TaxID=3039392 RepID=UPI0024AE2799|nr:hypothetical protein [Paenibacillus sp. RC67]